MSYLHLHLYYQAFMHIKHKILNKLLELYVIFSSAYNTYYSDNKP